MVLNAALNKDENQRLLIEGARISLFMVILLVSIASYLFQPAFINWTLLAPFYALVTVALTMHLGILASLERLFRRPGWLFATFVIDALLISALILLSGLNQSLFLFLHLVNILLAGLVFRTEGGLIVALLTSVFFTAASLLGPDLKALSFILLLALNNIAFFLVAGLSGYLSDQLDTVGAELRRAGLSLRAARELNRLVIENIPSGLLTFDQSGQVLQANRAAQEILGEDNLAGRDVHEILKGFEPRGVGEIARVDFKFQPPQGESKLLGLLASGFESPELGAPVRLLLIDDLTKIRQLEWGLRQAEKMAAIGQLAAGIAHEIRNPLSGISGSVELLSQTSATEDDRKLMKIILREIDRLNGLITEFLDYSRPEQPPTDPVDLVVLLQETLGSVALGKNVRQDVECIPQWPATAARILGRSEKLRQAFLNMFLNSYQAMENTLHPRLELSVVEDAEFVTVKIRDNGCGMSEATRKRIFEPFHTTKAKGTGLGLAVTHKILEGHGARIFVESEEGRGTEFTLVFPRWIEKIRA
ncbi:MAG: PAS domain-containing protein [Bdellovibrionaceae bacterium]|nr:PAS domain-containing protein [Pseudobdellovibrionaceae bacterium]